MKRRISLGILLAVPWLGCGSHQSAAAVTPVSPPRPAASADLVSKAPPSVGAQRLEGSLDPSQFLAAVDVLPSDALALDELEIWAPDYAGPAFGELTARKLLLAHDAGGKLRVRSNAAYPAPTAAVQSGERRCSFVIDCDELAVRGLVAELRASHPNVTADDVVKYVYRFIEHKHMARGFDIASIVAEKREGDCTEHAVLTAALLRGTGNPAHVVTGLVLLQIDGKWSAFGHAWTEYHDGERWQLADATNVGEVVEKLRYVPLHVMKDEGPGYSRAALDAFDVVDIRKVGVPTQLQP